MAGKVDDHAIVASAGRFVWIGIPAMEMGGCRNTAPGSASKLLGGTVGSALMMAAQTQASCADQHPEPDLNEQSQKALK